MYEENLARIKKEVSDFKIQVLSMYKDHIESLSRVPEIKREPTNVVDEQQVPQEEPVQPQEEAVQEPVAEENQAYSPENANPENESKFNNISSLFD